MFNTIILRKGYANLTNGEYKRFSYGDTIFGDNSNSTELKRWNIEQEQEAKQELAKYACVYFENIDTWSIEEYALEYCECGENGEFIQGSDYDLAKEDQIEKAYRIHAEYVKENDDFDCNLRLPNLKEGDICTLADVWDGDRSFNVWYEKKGELFYGDIDDDCKMFGSFAYILSFDHNGSFDDGLNYEFEYLDTKDADKWADLDARVRIREICCI